MIRNLSTGAVLARHAATASTLTQRLIGLIGRRSLEAGEALILPRCRSIHTCFMRFPIDVVFVSRGVVTKAVAGLGPFRLQGACEADTVIELPAGTLQRTATQPGQEIAWRD